MHRSYFPSPPPPLAFSLMMNDKRDGGRGKAGGVLWGPAGRSPPPTKRSRRMHFFIKKISKFIYKILNFIYIKIYKK